MNRLDKLVINEVTDLDCLTADEIHTLISLGLMDEMYPVWFYRNSQWDDEV